MSGFCQTRSMWPERALHCIEFCPSSANSIPLYPFSISIFEMQILSHSIAKCPDIALSVTLPRKVSLPSGQQLHFRLVVSMIHEGYSGFFDQVSKKWCLEFKFFCSHAMRKLGWTRSTNLPFRRDWKCCVLDVAVWNFVPSTSPDLFGGSECLCSERCRILSGGVSVHVKG